MASFESVYQQYALPVYRFLLSLTGEENTAEELLQETFYQAFLHIDRFEGRSSLYTWLCTIGKNAWLKQCRRTQRFTPAAEECLAGQTPGPEEAYIRREERALLRRAVAGLDEPYRDVLILHVYGGLSLKEIAQIHNKSESWARVIFFRAKQKITEEVSK